MRPLSGTVGKSSRHNYALKTNIAFAAAMANNTAQQ